MRRFLFAIPVLAALAVYAIAPRGEFVWDDQILVEQQMSSIRSFSDVWQPPRNIPQWTYDYFRPVVVATYYVDRRVFGLDNAAGAHATNVLAHVLTTSFVWLLLVHLLRDRPGGAVAAAIAATIFAVHPIHTESVSWITGRSDLLATMFFVPAVYFALLWRDRGSIVALLLSPLAFLLAMLSKEVAIAGLAVLPVLMLVKVPASAGRGTWREQALTWVGIIVSWLVAAGYYLSLRAVAGAGLGEWPIYLFDLLLKASKAAAWYVVKVLAPWPQSNFVVADMLPSIELTLVVIVLAFIALWSSLWFWRRSGDGIAFAGIWWIGATILPSLVVTFAGVAVTPVAERYLFLPSVGLSLVAGAVLVNSAGTRWARGATAVSIVIILAFALTTVQRGFIWLSDLRLWTDTTAKVKTHGLPWVELGKARQAAGDDDGAIEAFLASRALENTPKMTAITEFNLGAMYAERRQIVQAREAFNNAVAANPAYARGHYGLGRLLFEETMRPGAVISDERRLEKLAKVIIHLERAVSLAPGFISARLSHSRALLARSEAQRNSGQQLQALSSFRAAKTELAVAKRIEPGIAGRSDVRALERQLNQGLN